MLYTGIEVTVAVMVSRPSFRPLLDVELDLSGAVVTSWIHAADGNGSELFNRGRLEQDTCTCPLC